MKIKTSGSDWGTIYKELQTFFKPYMVIQGDTTSVLPSGSIISAGGWKWDKNNIGSGIEVSSDGMVVFLKEGPYMFRTVFGDISFNNGIHYWEIHADSRTENELKIGVSIKRDINMNSAFCDTDVGFAFYGLGQLRNGSNASGSGYGKKFKKEGALGIFLDMNKGVLAFSLNGESFGPAFKDEKLKKGPIWPAVSLLHCAGCRLETGKKIPNYFLN
jgi:E3 ubiquitin-protein ligase NRDP1